jgi:UDP-N-acetyl-D-glucosamine dehydrogenase
MIKSKSPLTSKVYSINTDSSDQDNIDEFLSDHEGKPVVVIQGLGFVGAVMSLICANSIKKDYAVLGVDLLNEQNYWKICSLNEGVFPLVAEDPKIESFYSSVKKKNNFYATYDEYAYTKADVIIVDINLDVDKQSNKNKDIEGYDIDLTGFKKAITSIGLSCKEDVLILVETTVPPGTTDKIIKPIIQNCMKNRDLSTDKLRIGHSYERVMPGPGYIDSIQNFYRVFSGVDDESANATEVFLKTIISTDEYPLTRLEATTSTEMAKVLENSYRAMNIAFAVEWSRFAEEAGVNLYEIVNAIRMRPTHANLMFPGIGVGGYCLTKDPLMASWARQHLIGGKEKLMFSESGVETNDKMPIYAFNYFLSLFGDEIEGKCILLMGVSYRNEIGDTRYTPVETFYDLCLEKKAEITLHDPYVNFWEETGQNICGDFQEISKHQQDAIIISTGHKYYSSPDCINLLMEMPSSFIYDTIGIWDKETIHRLSEKHTVKMLGRGDL